MKNEDNALNEVTNKVDVCPECNAITSGEKYCHNCGKNLSENINNYCTKCGNKLSNRANFCSNCGEDLKRTIINENKTGTRQNVPPKLEIAQNTSGNLLCLIGASLFVIICFLMLFMSYQTYIDIKPFGTDLTIIYYLYKIISIIGILFFGYGAIYFIKRIIENKPLIIVNEYGITDNSSATSVGFIPWNNIDGLFLKTSCSNKFIQVNLKNKIKNRSYIYITLNSTGIDTANFLQQILEYRKSIDQI